jgi:predicted amidohydrolase YtcJ
MKKSAAACLLVAVSVLASCTVTDHLVLRNGAVYTVDAARSWADAVAVAGGRIVYVGPESGIEAWIGPRTRVIDLQGKMLLPGFHDVHTHLVEGGVELSECRLDILSTVEQVLQAVKRCAGEHPKAAWIRGGGWQLPLFPDANPHKKLLDEAVPGRPVILRAADGHSIWASSRALELAGITRETSDPPNGRIERDPQTGEPTGTLREAAIGLLSKAVPPRTEEDYEEGLRLALRETARSGITSIQDAAAREPLLRAYAALDQRGELTVRAAAALRVDTAKGVADLPRLTALRDQFHGRRLRVIAAKIFADGVIEAKTAALLEPYVGTNDRGPANLTPELFDQLVTALDKEKFQVHVHAIGDRAVRMALDAFEAARKANGRRDSRHQIAHLELIDPHDIPRFQSLGAIADFQPLWAFPDPYIVKLTVPVLGEERSQWLYPIGSVARTGAVLACGSDWNVTPMNVPAAIQVAVTRRDPTPEERPKEGEAWLPQHLVDLPAMLACYTINGAYTNFEERETGSIETGKAADLVVLDRNLFTVPKSEIVRTKVLLTLLEGRETWRDPAFQP